MDVLLDPVITAATQPNVQKGLQAIALGVGALVGDESGHRQRHLGHEQGSQAEDRRCGKDPPEEVRPEQDG